MSNKSGMGSAKCGVSEVWDKQVWDCNARLKCESMTIFPQSFAGGVDDLVFRIVFGVKGGVAGGDREAERQTLKDDSGGR